MVQINFALREVNCKIVYYGPGLSGKTTNIEVVHLKAPESNKGELTSIATEGDRTLFFDYMPLDLGNIAGMRTKFQLYTVPGQVYYNSTRKLVLQGVDGIIFVADSQADKLEENLESLENLRNNLVEAGKDIEQIPMLIQYNKRDLPNALDVGTLNEKLNPRKLPTFEAVANTGEGVFPTLKALSSIVLENLSKQRSASSSRPISQAAKTPVGATARGPAPRAAPALHAAQAAPAAVAAPSAPPPATLPPQPEELPVRRPAAGPPTTEARRTPPPTSKGRRTSPAALSGTQDHNGAGQRQGGPPQQPAMPEPDQTKSRRPVPTVSTLAGRAGKPQAQKVEIGGNHRGKILTLVALGIVVVGALGLILNSLFGVL
jgi:signal recognition particle receptor subunit beta